MLTGLHSAVRISSDAAHQSHGAISTAVHALRSERQRNRILVRVTAAAFGDHLSRVLTATISRQRVEPMTATDIQHFLTRIASCD
jgi:hypothetical protein